MICNLGGENRELFLGTVKSLAAAIDGKDLTLAALEAGFGGSQWLSLSAWACRTMKLKDQN